MSNKYVEYNNNVDTAVDAAVTSSVEAANSALDLQVNFDDCVNRFYNSLYASFGALDDPIHQQDLKLYTPVIALADVDGFYVMYNNVNASGTLVKTKTQKIPYLRVFDITISGFPIKYSVAFTIGDECTVTITNAGHYGVYKGKYYELKEKYPGTYLASIYDKTILCEPGTFNNWKNHVMTTQLCEYMNYYAKHNNSIANDYGITYSFNLPESASSELANGLSNVTFIALFQGYPYGSNTNNVFNKFCVSGAHIIKTKVFYVRPTKEADGTIHYYYHKYGCDKLGPNDPDLAGVFDDEFMKTYYGTGDNRGYAFSTDLEAAQSGAMPCPYCWAGM